MAPYDIRSWNWADWMLAMIASGIAWMFVVSVGLATAGIVRRLLNRP
jgi:hypothetical protein